MKIEFRLCRTRTMINDFSVILIVSKNRFIGDILGNIIELSVWSRGKEVKCGPYSGFANEGTPAD